MQSVLLKAKQGMKVPLEHLGKRERIAPELRAIIDKATALAPRHRYPSVSAMADNVRRHLRGEAILARPDTRSKRSPAG